MYLPVDCRVWRRVAELADVYGPAVDGAVLIPLTQDDVAHLAGTTRPTANKVLRTGEERGVLRIGRGRIEVLEVDAVRTWPARSDRPTDASRAHRVGTVSVCTDGCPPSWSFAPWWSLRAVPPGSGDADASNATPSDHAKMICADEAQEDLEATLGAKPIRVSPRPGVSRCTRVSTSTPME